MMVNRIREYFRDIKRDRYFARMKVIRDKYVEEKNLVIGGRYSGQEYGKYGARCVGELLCVDASSDGIYAALKTDEGKVIQDVYADSLCAE